MQIGNENPLSCSVAVKNPRRSLMFVPEIPDNDSRLDFRRASGHLSQKESGYYLVLLRTEIRRRNLRGKSSFLE